LLRRSRLDTAHDARRQNRKGGAGEKKGETTMPRVKRGTKRSDRRKKILDRASGYFLTKSKLYQAAQEAVERGLKFGYRGRREKKRQYRSLWIVRIAAAAKQNGTSYSQLINGLKRAGVELDRKILADIAVHDATGFTKLVQQAKAALATEKAA
jgi:large subunit ribosomal protein L20